jgi:hypothetical protein
LKSYYKFISDFFNTCQFFNFSVIEFDNQFNTDLLEMKRRCEALLNYNIPENGQNY